MSAVVGQAIGLERSGAVAVITVDRPKARNALTSAMRQEIVAHCAVLREDRELRAVVFRGAGGTFIAGADLREFSATPTVADFLALERGTEAMYQAIEELPMPTIAVIEGYAIGGGLALAACCDLRVCVQDARLGMPIARTVGNCLSPSDYRRLTALVGGARLKELVIYAELVSAETAHTWGLISEIVDPGALEERLAALTAQLAVQAPLTMWATKESVRRLRDGDETGLDILETVMGSRDFREGVSAFLEKREPQWRNE